jgi:hypothetical protein
MQPLHHNEKDDKATTEHLESSSLDLHNKEDTSSSVNPNARGFVKVPAVILTQEEEDTMYRKVRPPFRLRSGSSPV